MNYTSITHDYYSHWLGITPDMMTQTGILFVPSSERDIRQPGYSKAHALYTYVTDNLIVVSYSDRLTEKIELLKHKLNPGMKAGAVADELKKFPAMVIKHSIKFCYHQVPAGIDTSAVKQLTGADYPLYLDLYQSMYPDETPDDWLPDYFNEITSKGYSFGLIVDNLLISATDAPTMPYMPDQVQEIGINTRAHYRGKGYAKTVTLGCINYLLAKNICPQWSCASNNLASERLAYAVGFRKLADVITASN